MRNVNDRSKVEKKKGKDLPYTLCISSVYLLLAK